MKSEKPSSILSKLKIIDFLPEMWPKCLHFMFKDIMYIYVHIYGILKDDNDNPICKTEKETQMYRIVFWTLWEKARVGCFKRTASKHVYYLE